MEECVSYWGKVYEEMGLKKRSSYKAGTSMWKIMKSGIILHSGFYFSCTLLVTLRQDINNKHVRRNHSPIQSCTDLFQWWDEDKEQMLPYQLNQRKNMAPENPSRRELFFIELWKQRTLSSSFGA